MEAKRARKETDQAESEGRFSEKTFAPVLAEGEVDYDDYSQEELNMFPELGYSEKEVEKVVKTWTLP